VARAGGVNDPVENFLTPSLITKPNLVAVSHAVCAHVGCHRNFWDANSVGVDDPWNHAHPRVIVQNLIALKPNRMGVGRIPKMGMLGLRPLGGVADPVEIRPSPTCVALTNVVVLGQTVNRRKNLTPRVPLFKVTQGHRNRHGSIGYVMTSY